MVTFVTVHNEEGLQNILLVQHRSRTNFSEDWRYAIRITKGTSSSWSIFLVYKMLEDMGWSITSLHCTEVSY